MALAAIILIGGGRRLLWAWRARKAVARLSEAGVTPEEIEAVAEFGRSGVWELLAHLQHDRVGAVAHGRGAVAGPPLEAR